MKFSDILQETFSAVTVNKARSSLTILGIVIGIGSVIAMISIGQGAQQDIQARIESIGSNLLTVYPGAQRGFHFGGASQGAGSAQTLIREDALAIEEQVSNIKAVAPEVSSRYQVTARGTNTNTSVIGTTPEYPAVKNVQIASGTFFSDQNISSSSKVAILGPDTATELFGEGIDPVGERIRINNINFTVIGVTVAKGGSGFGSSDDLILIPLSTAQRFLIGDDHLSNINVQVQDQESMGQAEEDITNLLLVRHGISDPLEVDFNIFNQADIIETATSITQTFTILLGAIAGISLVVGGIGIMNMMLTTVTERTREIGLRKAIGAKGRDIRSQFLMEAIMLTVIGGAIGVALGWLISFGVSTFAGITTDVSLFSVVLAFSVSAGIGIIFGYYPAQRASKLNPIDALRYE